MLELKLKLVAYFKKTNHDLLLLETLMERVR